MSTESTTSRRRFLWAGAGLTAAGALTLSGVKLKNWYDEYVADLRKSAFERVFDASEAARNVDYRTASLRSCMNVLADMGSEGAQDHYGQSDMLTASERITRLMHERGLTEVIRSPSGGLYDCGNTPAADLLRTHMGQPIVCGRGSRIFEHICAEAGPNRSLIADNVKYIVLTPGLMKDVRGTSTEEAGLYAGGDIVYIDTKAAKGPRDPSVIPPVTAHEAKHIEHHGKGYSVLMRELEATEAERSTIRSQINCSDVTKPTPQNMRGHFWFSTHRIETARYLQDNFKGEFSNVYPGESITSADLLEGKVTAEDLRKHINVDTGNSQMDGELRDAASIALIVHENNTTDATVKLRGIATSKKADVSQRQRLNAIHALSFLYPKGFKKASPIEYTAQQERDLANPFGGEGDALESKIVIPSSDELRASRRGGPKKKGRISSLNEPDPQIKPIEAEKQDALDLVNTPLVGEWKKVTEKMMDLLNELNAAFGSCPGKPKGFTYNGWMRRKGGGTIVYFQDQRIKVASHYEDSGLPVKIKTGKHKGEQVYIVLTKQDEYDENRRYIGTTFGFLDEYLEKDENKRPAHIKLD